MTLVSDPRTGSKWRGESKEGGVEQWKRTSRTNRKFAATARIAHSDDFQVEILSDRPKINEDLRFEREGGREGEVWRASERA